MKILILLITILICSAVLVDAHENNEYKHGSTPFCYGWELLPAEVRKCFIDEERKMCVRLVFNHGQWHVGTPYECTESE